MVIGVAIEKSWATVFDLKTGRHRFKLGKRGASHVTSDGLLVVVAHPQERSRLYNARGGSLGYVGGKGVASLNLVDGLLLVGYENARPDIIDLRRFEKEMRNPMERLQALARNQD